VRTGLLPTAIVTNVRRGPAVPLVDGHLNVPGWLEYTVTGAGPYIAHLRTELEDGRYEIARYTLERLPGGPPLEAAQVRDMPLRSIAAFGNLTCIEGADLDYRLDGRSGTELRALGVDDPAAGTIVAVTYQLALMRGEHPVPAVAKRLECSQATASKFIAAAKDHGHLKVSPVHKRGGSDR
jgi:hypothetical protein